MSASPLKWYSFVNSSQPCSTNGQLQNAQKRIVGKPRNSIDPLLLGIMSIEHERIKDNTFGKPRLKKDL